MKKLFAFLLIMLVAFTLISCKSNDSGSDVTYQKVAAQDATFESNGNTEYYIGSDGKYYVKNGDKYEEIAANSWVIPAKELTYTKVAAKEATETTEGNTEYYIGSDGKYYVKDGSSYKEVAANSWVIPTKDRTYTKVEATDATYDMEGNYEYYIGSDGKYYAKDGDTYVEVEEGSWVIPVLEPTNLLAPYELKLSLDDKEYIARLWSNLQTLFIDYEGDLESYVLGIAPEDLASLKDDLLNAATDILDALFELVANYQAADGEGEEEAELDPQLEQLLTALNYLKGAYELVMPLYEQLKDVDFTEFVTVSELENGNTLKTIKTSDLLAMIMAMVSELDDLNEQAAQIAGLYAMIDQFLGAYNVEIENDGDKLVRIELVVTDPESPARDLIQFKLALDYTEMVDPEDEDFSFEMLTGLDLTARLNLDLGMLMYFVAGFDLHVDLMNNEYSFNFNYGQDSSKLLTGEATYKDEDGFEFILNEGNEELSHVLVRPDDTEEGEYRAIAMFGDDAISGHYNLLTKEFAFNFVLTNGTEEEPQVNYIYLDGSFNDDNTVYRVELSNSKVKFISKVMFSEADEEGNQEFKQFHFTYAFAEEKSEEESEFVPQSKLFLSNEDGLYKLYAFGYDFAKVPEGELLTLESADDFAEPYVDIAFEAELDTLEQVFKLDWDSYNDGLLEDYSIYLSYNLTDFDFELTELIYDNDVAVKSGEVVLYFNLDYEYDEENEEYSLSSISFGGHMKADLDLQDSESGDRDYFDIAFELGKDESGNWVINDQKLFSDGFNFEVLFDNADLQYGLIMTPESDSTLEVFAISLDFDTDEEGNFAGLSFALVLRESFFNPEKSNFTYTLTLDKDNFFFTHVTFDDKDSNMVSLINLSNSPEYNCQDITMQLFGYNCMATISPEYYYFGLFNSDFDVLIVLEADLSDNSFELNIMDMVTIESVAELDEENHLLGFEVVGELVQVTYQDVEEGEPIKTTITYATALGLNEGVLSLEVKMLVRPSEFVFLSAQYDLENKEFKASFPMNDELVEVEASFAGPFYYAHVTIPATPGDEESLPTNLFVFELDLEEKFIKLNVSSLFALEGALNYDDEGNFTGYDLNVLLAALGADEEEVDGAEFDEVEGLGEEEGESEEDEPLMAFYTLTSHLGLEGLSLNISMLQGELEMPLFALDLTSTVDEENNKYNADLSLMGMTATFELDLNEGKLELLVGDEEAPLFKLVAAQYKDASNVAIGFDISGELNLTKYNEQEEPVLEEHEFNIYLHESDLLVKFDELVNIEGQVGELGKISLSGNVLDYHVRGGLQSLSILEFVLFTLDEEEQEETIFELNGNLLTMSLSASGANFEFEANMSETGFVATLEFDSLGDEEELEHHVYSLEFRQCADGEFASLEEDAFHLGDLVGMGSQILKIFALGYVQNFLDGLNADLEPQPE